MFLTFLFPMLMASYAQAKVTQSIQWISESQVKELRNALESYYLSCGFYPTLLADLMNPLPNQICKAAVAEAAYTDPDGSRAKKMSLMEYNPTSPKDSTNDFQQYEIKFQILKSK